MAAGKKTQNFNMGQVMQQQQHFSIHNSSVRARNLSENELGAVIFGCNDSTMEEGFKNWLFGLPAWHFSYVRKIRPGLPLFLFNYSDRKMHGIYEAASYGQWNIKPYMWTADGSEKTPFPAQVHFQIRKQCKPLFEEEYMHIISDNYHGGGSNRHFWFELDHAQTGELLSLFESSPDTDGVTNSVPARSHLQKHSKSAQKQAQQAFSETAPTTVANPFKESTDSVREANWAHGVYNYMEVGSSSMIAGSKEDDEIIQIQESHPDRAGMETDFERVYLKLKQISLLRGNLNTFPKSHTEEAFVPCMTSETYFEDDCPPATPVIPKKREDVSIDSSHCPSEIYQLRNKIEDLKLLLSECRSCTNALESKLECSNAEIQQLQEKATMLEYKIMYSSVPFVGEASESQGIQRAVGHF